MKKSIFTIILTAIALFVFAQQKPPFPRSVGTQTVQDRALKAAQYFNLPSGTAPYFPTFVADSNKCGSLFLVKPGIMLPGLYIYNCVTSSWEQIASNGNFPNGISTGGSSTSTMGTVGIAYAGIVTGQITNQLHITGTGGITFENANPLLNMTIGNGSHPQAIVFLNGDGVNSGLLEYNNTDGNLYFGTSPNPSLRILTTADLIAGLPSQSGNSGKYLTTNGTIASWATVSGGGVWGSITGTLSSQTDLNTALNGKQSTITTGSTSQYFRGDLSLATFPTIPTTSNYVANGTGLQSANFNINGSGTAGTFVASGSIQSTGGSIQSGAGLGTRTFITAASGLQDESSSWKLNVAANTGSSFAGTVHGLALTDPGGDVYTGYLDNSTGDFTETLNGTNYILTTTSGDISLNPSTNNNINLNVSGSGFINVSGFGTITPIAGVGIDGSGNLGTYTIPSGGTVSDVFGRTGSITATSGDYNTSQVTEVTNLYFTNARSIAAPLTGWTSGAGTVSSSDNVLQGLQKINGNQVVDASNIATNTSNISTNTSSISTNTSNIATNTTAIATKQQQLIQTAVKTANYTLSAFDYAIGDAAGGTFTFTLPNAPADGTDVETKMVNSSGTNSISLATQGVDVFNGGGTSASLSSNYQGITFKYKASNHTWYSSSTNLSLTQLDARYSPIFSGSGYSKYASGVLSYITAIPNADLANSSTTINGTSINLGSSGTVTAAAGTVTGATLNSSVTASSLTSFGSSPTFNTPIFTGLPTGSGVSNTSSASTLAARDANSNLYANAFHPNFTTTVSSATPIVLTVGSTQVQEITGSTAQTITLPVASTLTTGWTVIVTSSSSAAVTIQSSGGNTVATLQNGNTATIWCALNSGTGLSSWDRSLGSGSFSGTAGGVPLTTGATMNTLTLTGTTNTGAIAAGASSITAGVFNNSKAGAGTTAQAGVSITNITNATAGTPNQYGLDLTWTFSAWNTTPTAAANALQFAIEPRGITGATTGSNVFLKYQNNGGGYTDAYSFNANGNFTALTGTVILHGYTVSTLPSTHIVGATAYVTDALTPSFGTTLVGGGAIVTKAFDNGTNWVAE